MKNFLNLALESNNTVIIPGFGALTITSARTKDIYFIPYLKHDDGTLNKVICDQKGIDKIEAKKFIQEYVELIKKSVDDTNFFEIENFGRFKKLHTGDIEFEKWEEYHKEDKSILAKTLKTKQKNQKENIKPTEEIPVKHTSDIIKEKIASNEEVIIETYIPEIKNKDLEEILNVKETLGENNKIIEESPNEIENSSNSEKENVSTIFDNNIISEIIEKEKIETPTESENDESIYDIKVKTEIEKTQIQNENQIKDVEIKKENKSKRKVKKEKKEDEHINIEKEKTKKKKTVLPWLVIGIAFATGIITYTLYTRKNEKIVITEKITHTESSSKKEIKAEIIKDKEIENEKKEIKIENKKENKKIQLNKPEKKNNKINENKIEVQKKKTAEKKIIKEKTTKKEILKQEIVEKKEKQVNTPTKTRPTKKELAEADNIVNQLNTNKKNNEAVNTIKNNVTTNSNKSSNNTTNTIQQQNTTKNLNQNNNQLVTSNNSKNNITTQQTTVNNTKTSTPVISNKTNVNQQGITNSNTTQPVKQSNLPSTTNSKNLTPTTNKTNTNQQANNSNTSQTTKINNSTKQTNQQVSTKPLTGGVAGKKIELIADTYKDKASAEKLVTKLKDGGYKNTRIEEKDGQYNVVIDSYSTLSETMKELRKYRGQ